MPTAFESQDQDRDHKRPASRSPDDRLSVREVWGLIALLGGSFLVVLDFFIVMVALPSIQTDLHASSASIQMVVTGYGLANAIALITGGKLGDVFGRQRMFQLGLGLFLIASMACAVATTAPLLIAARVVQGLAGALLQPQVLGIVSTLYSGARRARVFAWYAVAIGSAGVVAQLLGGLLIHFQTAASGWRSCFLINLPIGIAALLLVRRFVASDKGHDSKIDIVGVVLSATAFLLLALALTYGREHGWPLWSLACLPASLVTAYCLYCHEARLERSAGTSARPLFPTELLRVRSFRGGLLRVLIFYAGIASFYFILALHLQQELGFSALGAGSLFAVLASAFVAASLSARRMRNLVGMEGPLFGICVLVTGHIAMALAVWQRLDSIPVFVMCLAIQGAGIGLAMVPLVSSTLAGVPPAHAGVAGGVLSTFQQTGNSLGVTLIGLLFFGSAAQTGFLVSLQYLIGINTALALLLLAMSLYSRRAARVILSVPEFTAG